VQGAIVVLDPNNGEVLALENSPSFNPNAFIEPARSVERAKLLTDPTRPLFNRAVMGQYPPGSTFKMITALAALENQKVSPKDSYHCSGEWVFGGMAFRCWNEEGHGSIGLLRAIASSCNVYFYRLGLSLGAERLAHQARKLGLGRVTGIGLRGEAPGLVPDASWKRSKRGKPWYDGESAHFSIGQGYLLVTPLQVVRFVSVFANGGFLVNPHLVKGAGDKPKDLGINPENIETVRRGLFQVVNASWGTGGRASRPGLQVSGKTGTAEVAGHKTHAWFCGYSSLQDPDIAVVVFIEHGGQGSAVAAYMAGEIFLWWQMNRA
jgi:penicillin-binding protein 2